MARRIVGVGPIPCPMAIVGPYPGKDEAYKGYPFAGKTGEELNRFLDGTNLPERSELFLTNLHREYKGKDPQYSAEEWERDAAELREEIAACEPEIIVTLGRDMARFFLGDVDMDDVHSLPWRVREGTPIVFPVYHPAAGFHSPELAGLWLYGMQQLGAFLREELKPRILYDDPHPEPRYIEITNPHKLAQVFHASFVGRNLRRIGVDTEGSAKEPWSLQFSFEPGVAYVVRAKYPAVVARFAQLVAQYKPDMVFHSALHDLSVTRALGIPMEGIRFDDTAICAYLLQVEPRGLKPLCIRHANMKMQSYDEVLDDAANRLARDYFVALFDIEECEYVERQEAEFAHIISTPVGVDKKGQPKFRRITKLPNVPKTALHKAVVRGLRSHTPRRLWNDWEENQPQVRIEAFNRLGDMPEATLDHTELPKALHYAARDADGTTRLFPDLSARVDAMKLRKVYELELGTYRLIDRMQQIGIKPDLSHFKALSGDLALEIADLQVSIEQHTGIRDFNANSGDQVAAYVFDTLGLEGMGRRTESGRFSTNDKVLEALEKEHPEHPVLSDIRGYREVFKLKNTFTDVIPYLVKGHPYDGRVHVAFRTTSVVTGRLAASMPPGMRRFNLLAQPKHGKFARPFRRGWRAEDGHWLGEWDLSQAELRVLAHLSQDPVMLATFRKERRNPDGSVIDLHAALAQRIFGVAPKDQNKSKHRLPAKAINFGLPMGMTFKGLTVELRKNGVNVSEDDAQRWIDETMGLYKGVPQFQERMKAEARRNGLIRCLSGRIRYIGGIKSRDEHVRAEAERLAFSTPIQEGAQYIIKGMESQIWDDVIVYYHRQGRYVEPLLQVHDALDLEFEADPTLAADLNRRMLGIMSQVPDGFTVPMEAEGEYGLSLCSYDEDDQDELDMRHFDADH